MPRNPTTLAVNNDPELTRRVGELRRADPALTLPEAVAIAKKEARQLRASRLLAGGSGHPHGWTEEERRYVEGGE